MPLSEIDKRKFFQRVKGLTHDQFWEVLNEICTKSYERGVGHVKEAMGIHHRISKPMVQWVMDKAQEIRVDWDGIDYKEAESNLEELVLGGVKRDKG